MYRIFLFLSLWWINRVYTSSLILSDRSISPRLIFFPLTKPEEKSASSTAILLIQPPRLQFPVGGDFLARLPLASYRAKRDMWQEQHMASLYSHPIPL